MPILLPNPVAKVECPGSDLAQQSSRTGSSAKPHWRGRSCSLLPQILMAFLALALTTSAMAQADVARPERPRPEPPRPARPRPEPGKTPGLEPKKCLFGGDCAPRPYSALHVYKGKISLTNSDTKTQWTATEGASVTRADITKLLGGRKVIIHDGDPLSGAWLEVLKDYSYVQRSRWSPNSDRDAAAAAELGDLPLDVENTKFYNSLPQETGYFSNSEMRRMGLDRSRRKEWQDLNRGVVQTAASLRLNMEVARKKELMDDLRYGDKNVVFLIAHSDGIAVYLPGLLGESISLDEFSRIQRTKAPNRIIVTIVCEGGGVNGDQASLAELFLKNRLAKTVFASPGPVNARFVPQLLQRLSEGATLRDALKMLDEPGSRFQQYVDLIPFGFWRRLPVHERPL